MIDRNAVIDCRTRLVKRMKKIQNKYGFSMAELLMVVAILVALFGVAFVAVQNHQRSMTQLEYDTIAKEIFVAAQNHLTAAESQGYLGQIANKSEYGNESSFQDDETDEVYYFTVTRGVTGQEKILDLMLPFGSIDETIRAGGSYIIRYQPSSARVLDVFYSNPGPVTAWLTIKGAELDGEGIYTKLMELRGDENKSARRKCEAIGGAVVGWYGDGDALPVGRRLNAPEILIHNEESLWVEVVDTNTSNTTNPTGTPSLVLIVTGETSEAKKMFNLYVPTTDDTSRISTTTGESEVYKIVLDDITREGLHFAEIGHNTTSEFIPGENITVEAVAYNNGALTNIAYSGKGRTNSIFADPSSYIPDSTENQEAKTDDLKVNGTVVDGTSGTAAVANFRHLENLDKRVSKWGGDEVQFSTAIQLTNLSDGTDEDTEDPGLSWKSFVEKTAGVIYTTRNPVSKTNSEQYLPVNLEQGFSYFGRNHIISKVTTDGVLSAESTSLDAGVFGTLNGGSVSDLLILDSTFSSSGSAGGLIGSMSGTTVERCAANGTVTGGTAAGGLIGEASSGTVTACYSAGHTDKATYYVDGTVQFDEDGKPLPENCIFNVQASGTAGGLIGSSTAMDIKYSYSTCSVKGNTAGGFVGSVSGSISYCYATGLVSGATEGAFAGTYESGKATNCYYYEIINERKDDEKGFIYVDPVGGNESYPDITALDASAQTYNDFSLPKDKNPEYTWQPAVPYDDALKDYYQDQNGKSVYNLRTVTQLIALGPSDNSVVISDDALINTHYGDWPAPEIFVINSSSNG